MSISQCQTHGLPPVKSWADYRKGCLDTFSGGYRENRDIAIFDHGMNTVFNLLQAEFPPAEQCKAAPDLLAAAQAVLAAWYDYLNSDGQVVPAKLIQTDAIDNLAAAIASTPSEASHA